MIKLTALTLVFVTSLAAGAEPHFISAVLGYGIVNCDSLKISLSVNYRIARKESTLVCDNTCSWISNNIVDTTRSVTYASRRYNIDLKVDFAFFDSLNRQFRFQIADVQSSEGILQTGEMHGDTLASPGYGKSIHTNLTTSGDITSLMLLGRTTTGNDSITKKFAGFRITPSYSCLLVLNKDKLIGQWHWLWREEFTQSALSRYVNTGNSDLTYNFAYDSIEVRCNNRNTYKGKYIASDSILTLADCIYTMPTDTPHYNCQNDLRYHILGNDLLEIQVSPKNPLLIEYIYFVRDGADIDTIATANGNVVSLEQRVLPIFRGDSRFVLVSKKAVKTKYGIKAYRLNGTRVEIDIVENGDYFGILRSRLHSGAYTISLDNKVSAAIVKIP